MLRYKTKLDLV